MSVASSSQGAPASDGSGFGAPEQLLCQKCGDHTSMGQSAATGRNPLLRACNACLATDRWLARSQHKPKNGRPETEEEKTRRANACKVKEDLKKKTPEERKAWYFEQKSARAMEDHTKKRSFSSAVGSVEETREASSLTDDIDKYIPFKIWAQGEMALKTYATIAEAKLAWDKLIADPTTRTMKQNGETLIYEFGGVEVRARQAHGMKAALRQRMDISEQKDLDEYNHEADSRVKRARGRLEVEMTANAAADGDSQNVIPLLHVARDLGHLKEQEEARDLELHQQASELLQQRKAQQEERKKKQEAQGKSLPLEKLALDAARKKASQSMTDLVLRQQTTLKAIELDSEKVIETEGDDLKKERRENICKVQEAMETLEKSIRAKEKEWENALKGDTVDAEEVATLRAAVADYMKAFHTSNSDVKEVKNRIAELRNWVTKTKKAINDREKAAQKTAAGRRMAKMAQGSGLNLLATALAKECNTLEACGKVLYSFAAEPLLKQSLPCVFESQRAQNLLKAVKGLEYYDMQKAWVAEKMASSKATACSALISKKAVAAKVTDLVRKSWSEVTGNDGLKGLPDDLSDLFAVQFGQRLQQSVNVYLRTEMNLPMLLVVLEGSLTVSGFPSKMLGDERLAGQLKKLEAMPATHVTAEVARNGWVVKLQAGGSILVPPNTCWFEWAGPDEDTHSIRQLIARDAFVGPMKEWLQQMRSEGSVSEQDRLHKMLEFLQKQQEE